MEVKSLLEQFNDENVNLRSFHVFLYYKFWIFSYIYKLKKVEKNSKRNFHSSFNPSTFLNKENVNLKNVSVDFCLRLIISIV